MSRTILLGDEAVALGAIHAGITAAYAYPGTPATEIMEFLIAYRDGGARPRAEWTANEKTALESALGVAFAGRRAMVSMKHVGLNVAADPFVNSALVATHGGLLVAVADDPGMHSSQNEQDSRFYADFARVIALEPADSQQAYDMTRAAFDLSERFHVPVLLRLVTRLSHSRMEVETAPPRAENPAARAPRSASWLLLPANARRQWRELLERQPAFESWSDNCSWNALDLEGTSGNLGVITAGIARQYYLENRGELPERPPHLHIGAYPVPKDLVRRLVARVDNILVLEDGQPLIERQLHGLLGAPVQVMGRLSGHVSPDGELDPDRVRAALGLRHRPALASDGFPLPSRPPQLCQGCPHGHSFQALNLALEGTPGAIVTSDIGCYTLGALPPYEAGESCVCMGASIGMARGAADAGLGPVVAVIGDSTFLHSGVTGLLDAIAHDTTMTLLILDNLAVAMTGGQPPLVPSSRLRDVVLGLGVPPERCTVIDPLPRRVKDNAAILRAAIEQPGLSVVISVRECKETAQRRARARAKEVAL